jgi:hypothetical protein
VRRAVAVVLECNDCSSEASIFFFFFGMEGQQKVFDFPPARVVLPRGRAKGDISGKCGAATPGAKTCALVLLCAS